MDAPQSPVPTTNTPTPSVKPEVVSTKVKSGKKLSMKKMLMLLLALVMLAGAAYGGYWWRDRDAKKVNTANNAEIADLKNQLSAKSSDKEAEDAVVAPSAETLADIEAAVTSGNTAALESLMTDPVTVILAASEGLGERTPTEAISDLAYVIDLTATWDFSLPTATLDGYAAGDYAMYFPGTALIGKSSAGKVVSFSFDNSGKIKTVFMSASDLL